MSKEEKMIMDDSIHELSLEELQEVAAGKIKPSGYVMLTAVIAQFKALGKNKEYVIQAVKNGWASGCPFRISCTDGTDLDLQKAIDYVNRVW
jgi:hypothetical protein